MRGVFITFEGVEASGKSTLAKILYEWLLSNEVPAVFTRDPGGTEVGEHLRKLLLKEEMALDDITEALLYAAARRQLVVEVIYPSLVAGKVVVCDRFSDSFFAYQGFGRGLSLDLLKVLNDAATQGLMPNLTFLIDISPEVAFTRLKTRDRLESEDMEFHRRVYEGFMNLYNSSKERIVLLDGNKKLSDLFEEVKDKIAPFINLPA